MSIFPPCLPTRLPPRRPAIHVLFDTPEPDIKPSDDDHLTSAPVFGPPNPYDPNTRLGRKHIEHRDCAQFPTPVDKWLQAQLALYHSEDPRLVSTDVLCDGVSCKVVVECSPEIRNPETILPFLDDFAHHKLVLTVELPPDSPFDARWHKSPPTILDITYGQRLCGFGPDWCNMFGTGLHDIKEIHFTQSRSLVVGLFARLATESENIERSYSEPMLQWAQAVSPLAEAKLKVKQLKKKSFEAVMGRRIGELPDQHCYKLRRRDKTGKVAVGKKKGLTLRRRAMQ